ncbi:tyrosinase family protein [Actinocorallia sp. B10E7]|uniref:tyrosinase family protein n=1 Tax=Actinocorallia sp. B10E7 TaxID=3153558 RepID=UPI00325DE698
MGEISRRGVLRWAAGGAVLAGAWGPSGTGGAAVEAVRAEVRALPAERWERYVRAVRALNRRSGGASEYDGIVRVHVDHAHTAQGTPAFLPWNRVFLRRFELALQRIDPSVRVPYWDWTPDARAPAASVVLGGAYFGGNGSGEGREVRDGSFADWTVAHPSPHRLRRWYDEGSGLSAFPGAEDVEKILAEGSGYDVFRAAVESVLAAPVQEKLGGDLSALSAPNDPLFWSHRAFLDLLWAERQARDPTRARDYDGTSQGRQAGLGDLLEPFGVTVAATLDLRAEAFGYAYPRWGAAAERARRKPA